MSPSQVKDALEIGRRRLTEGSEPVVIDRPPPRDRAGTQGVWADNEAAGAPARDPSAPPPGPRQSDPSGTHGVPTPHFGVGSPARATREDWGRQHTIARQLEVGSSGEAPDFPGDLPGPAVIPPEVLALLERMEVRTIKAATSLHALDENLPAPRTVRHLVRRVAGEFDAMHDSLHALVLGDIEAREVWSERVASTSTPIYDALVLERLQILVGEALEARLSNSDTRPNPVDVRAAMYAKGTFALPAFEGRPVHEVRIDPSTLEPYREEIVLEETWRDHPDGVQPGHYDAISDALIESVLDGSNDRLDESLYPSSYPHLCWCQDPYDPGIRGRHHFTTCPALRSAAHDVARDLVEEQLAAGDEEVSLEVREDRAREILEAAIPHDEPFEPADPIEALRKIREEGERQLRALHPGPIVPPIVQGPHRSQVAASAPTHGGGTRLCLGCVARGHEHTYGPGCELDRPYDERDQDGEH